MDPAFLRRIPYKIGLPAPSEEEFLQTLQQESLAHGLESDDRIGPACHSRDSRAL